MARARSGGSTTTYAVATVLFAILFVFSLILAIIFYSRVAKAELTARLAVNDLRQFISSDQRGQQRLVMLEAMAGDEKKTIYELMTEEAATLRAIVNGNDTADIMTVQAQYKEVVSVEGRPLVGEVQQLQAELAELGTQIKVLTDQLEQQKVVAQEAIEANVELAAKYEQAKREDDAKYEELRTEFAQHQQKFEAGIEQIDSVLGEKLSTAQKDRDDKQLENDRLYSQIRDLNGIVRDLENTLAQRDKPVSTGVVPADGVIESMLTEEGLVYVDLGRRQHVQPGLTFEVYGRNELVKVGRFGDLEPRGKSTIEIIEVSEAASKARIVRLARGDQVLEGDLIYNLVYDKNWVPLLYVYGEFDIDRIGRATRTDRRRIEAMIRQWGGQVNDSLTYEVDYLVLGVEPDVPREPPETEVDPAIFERYREAKDRYEQYQALIDKALKLNIAVLNQNRFLHLVGQYQR